MTRRATREPGRHDDARVGGCAARLDLDSVRGSEFVVGMGNHYGCRAVAAGAHRLIQPNGRRPRRRFRRVADVHVGGAHDGNVHQRVAARRVDRKWYVLMRVARPAASGRNVERKASRVRIDVDRRPADSAAGLRQHGVIAGGCAGRYDERRAKGTGAVERYLLLGNRRGSGSKRDGRASAARPQDAPGAAACEADDAQRIAGVDDGNASEVTVRADGKEFRARVRLDTPRERDYFRHGGILRYVLRRLLAS